MKLLFQDDHMVAVHKPGGMLVHRSAIDRWETVYLLQLVRDLVGKRVYPVHRLDKPTSGVVLFALSSEDARRIGESFAARVVGKRYLAVVRGTPAPEGIIDYPLVEEPDRLTEPLASPDRGAAPAVTSFTRLAIGELPYPIGNFPQGRYSLLDINPLTGRRHQIRRHLKHLSHPIIGDTTYGDGRHNRYFREHLDCRRLLLAAVELTIPHPATGELVKIASSLEDDFAAVIHRFGWSDSVSRWLE